MDVTFPNRQGQALSCKLDYPDDEARGAVCVVHGFKGYSGQKHISSIAKSICEKGFITLRPDFTKDPGQSYLDFGDMTYGQEYLDLEDILINFAQRDEVKGLPLGICGHSLGGMLSAEIAANHKEIKTLVTLSAVFDFEHLAKNLFNKPFFEVKQDFREKGWSTVWSRTLSRELQIGKQFYEDSIFRTADDFVREIFCPTLVILSGKDEAVPQSHADSYYKKLGSDIKKMRIIEGSDHNYTDDKWLDEVCNLTSGWFADQLKPIATKSLSF